MVHQLLEHGGHDHGPVDPALLHRCQPLQRVELAHDHHGAAAVDRGQYGLKPGYVVQRHREQVAFLYVRVSRGHRGQQVGGEAVVGQHHPLGRAGGAGSEHNYGCFAVFSLGEVEFFFGGPGQQIFVANACPRRLPVQYDHVLRRDSRGCVQQRQIALPDEHDAGLSLGEHLGQFFFFGAEVDGNEYGVQLGGGEIDLDGLRAVHLHHRYPVALANAKAGHGVGKPVGAPLEFGERKGCAVEYYGGAVGHDGGGYGEKLGSPHCGLEHLYGQDGLGLQRFVQGQVGPPLQSLLGRGSQPGV